MPHRVLRTESARLPLYAALLAVSVTLLLGFTYAVAATQHAVGIYSQGQARWIQAHVRVVGALRRYTLTGERESLARAQDAYRIQDAYRRARAALAPGRVNRAEAVDAFMQGELTRHDAERAAFFGPVFDRLPTGRRVIDSWGEGDAQFDTLRVIGAALEREFANPPDAGRAARLLALRARIDSADARITALETTFADGLAETARMLPPLGLGVGVVIGLLLLGGSLLTVRRVAQTADRARAEQYAHFQRLNTLMDGVPDLISWIDRDGRYTHVNAAVERFTGIPREQMIHATDPELSARRGVGDDVVAPWARGLERAFAGHDETMILEIPDASGRQHIYQFRATPQRGPDGTVTSVMMAGRDLTALRESEAVLREREQQLRHAQKLEAVGRLAGGVAHEFNNILTAVTANIEVALLDLPESGRTRKELGDALAAARRAGVLTRQLLVLGRRDAFELSALDLGQLLAELEPMLQRLAGDTVTLVTAETRERAVIMADAGLLQQILFNLVSNARDAMPEGGMLHIEAGSATTQTLRQGKAVISGDPDEHAPGTRWATLVVRDAGTGMSQDVVDRLFEPFFTTKPPGAGSGLGLPVVNGLVLQLGGCICVETAPGRGTAITIGFPAADPAQAASALHATLPVPATADAAPDLHGRGELVLLVEDEASIRAVARRMLEHGNYRVVEAKHADDALLQWERAPADVVVTDFMMPGLTGAELLVRLRAQRPGLPALIVSGYTGGDTIDVKALGSNTLLLQKPFSRTELLARLRALLDGDESARA
jgi:PAS domain S-box-containing protein